MDQAGGPDVDSGASGRPGAILSTAIDLARRTSASQLLYPVSSLARKAALGLIGHRPVDYDYHGLTVRFLPRGNTAEKRALLNPGHFDVQEFAFLADFLPMGGVFLDVGANAGLYGLFAATVLGPTGRVLAFEPNPEVLRRLRTNIALNAKNLGVSAAPVDVVAKAVTDHNGPIHFAVPGRNLGEGQIVEGGNGEGVMTLEGVRLDDCLKDEGIGAIDAMKIDIEGHELKALQPFLEGAPTDLYPRAILIERGEADHWEPLAALLRQHGYKPHLACRMNEIWLHGAAR